MDRVVGSVRVGFPASGYVRVVSRLSSAVFSAGQFETYTRIAVHDEVSPDIYLKSMLSYGLPEEDCGSFNEYYEGFDVLWNANTKSSVKLGWLLSE